MTRHRSRTRQFLQGLGMDAKQCGCLLTVQEGLEFWKFSGALNVEKLDLLNDEGVVVDTPAGGPQGRDHIRFDDKCPEG